MLCGLHVQQVSNSGVGGERFCEVIGTSVLADPIISNPSNPASALYPACLHTNYAIKWPLCALLNTLLLWPSKMQYYQWCLRSCSVWHPPWRLLLKSRVLHTTAAVWLNTTAVVCCCWSWLREWSSFGSDQSHPDPCLTDTFRVLFAFFTQSRLWSL